MNRFNRFWRNTKTEKHRPDDPLETDPPAVPGAAPRTSRNIRCEFCECTLAIASGDVLKRGTKATEYLRQEDRIEELKKEIAKLQSEKTALETRIQELTPKEGSSAPRTLRRM